MAASVEHAMDFPWIGTVFLAEGEGKWLLNISRYMYSSFEVGGASGNLKLHENFEILIEYNFSNFTHYLKPGKYQKKIALACDWYHLKAHIF